MGTFCLCFHSYAWLVALLHNNGDRLHVISRVTRVTGEVEDSVDRWS
jgi:hypothetical protein